MTQRNKSSRQNYRQMTDESQAVPRVFQAYNQGENATELPLETRRELVRRYIDGAQPAKLAREFSLTEFHVRQALTSSAGVMAVARGLKLRNRARAIQAYRLMDNVLDQMSERVKRNDLNARELVLFLVTLSTHAQAWQMSADAEELDISPESLSDQEKRLAALLADTRARLALRPEVRPESHAPGAEPEAGFAGRERDGAAVAGQESVEIDVSVRSDDGVMPDAGVTKSGVPNSLATDSTVVWPGGPPGTPVAHPTTHPCDAEGSSPFFPSSPVPLNVSKDNSPFNRTPPPASSVVVESEASGGYAAVTEEDLE